MKQIVIISTAIALTFTSQLVAAAPITDNYADGNLLTATTMNNIKAAVNDNDTNVGTNATAIGNNATSIGTNTGDISTNGINIGINSSAITDHENRIIDLEASGTANASQTINCGTGCISLTTGSTATVNVRSVSVNASSATGRILVIFNGFIECSGVANDRVYVVSQITTSSTAVPNSVNSGGTSARFTLTDSNFTVFTMNMLTSFAVTSSGTKTFFANAKNFTTTSPFCKFFSGNMEAVHIP